MATSTYLQNSHTGTGSSTGEKATMSVWVKRTDPSGDSRSTIIGARTDDNNYMKIRFADNDRLMVYGTKAGSTNIDIQTNAEFRDVFGWYHIVLQLDTTNATETERIKWYVNGELQTIRSTDKQYPSQNDVNHLISASDINIGCNALGSPNEHFDGTMSHFHLIDGTIYAPTVFGSTDSTTGEWKINTSPSVTYGSKGFFILKDGNSVTDQSGNSNNFTVGAGTLTKTEDCPSNVFCTMSPLSPQTYTFSNGNNTIYRAGSTGQSTALATLAPSSGKWYWEIKLNSGQSDYPRIGIYEMNSDNHTYTNYLGQQGGGTGKWWGSGTSQTGIIGNGTDSSTAFFSYSNGDILMFAMDNDNGKLWLGKNGTWYTNDNSTTTTGTAIGNNTATPAFSNVTVGKNWTPAVFGNASGETWQCNFGNGYIGTSQVASAGTNASGIGIFEYDVPPNFTALSTKGLNL